MRFVSLACLAACGGSGPHANTPRLVPTVAMQAWYHSPAPCAQGPYELDVPIAGAKWGDEVSLRVHAPRPVALHAVVVVDGVEVDRDAGVFVGEARTAARPDNARCVASARERLGLVRGGGGGDAGAAGTPGDAGTAEPPAMPAIAPRLEPDPGLVRTSAEVISFRLTGHHANVRIKFWSIEPNDLSGVVFGIADVTWAPNVSEAQYEAFLAPPPPPARRVAAESHVQVQAEVRIDVNAERRAEEARRRVEIAAALEEARRVARVAYCNAHGEDRDCWGAGGRRVSQDLDAHERERAAYCAEHTEDARCWSNADWSRVRTAWDNRVSAAVAPPRQPDGPPPDPLAETIPPKLSAHAEWRAGYWNWTENTWVWLGGMWRVPDSDIVAEQTTTAPHAPPPLQVEVVPPAPVRVAVWVPGFWQWGGTSWVWIAGSWQLRPDARATWRAAEWRARGTVHVLVPGGWVHP